MDFLKVSEGAGYEPYTDEFDIISDISELVTVDRGKEIIEFLTKYRTAGIERPLYPTDRHELMIVVAREKDEDELVQAIPRGAPRKHILDFMKASKDIKTRLETVVTDIGLSPEQTSVTFLIENAGSTRGVPAYHIAMSTMETCKALDALGIQTSVIGYTTRSWKNSQTADKWAADGKPENPGRLDDVLKIVYKRPESPLDARALGWLHMIAEPKLKRENIFGEGLMWGAQAAASVDRENKLLIHVVSKPNSQSSVSLARDPEMKDKFFRHQEAIVHAIDDAGEIAMSTVLLGDGYWTKDMPYETRQALGQMMIASDKITSADVVLEAFIDGTTAAMERAMEISREPASTI